MNSLILNRESFEMPADGWYQIAPVGEFPHAAAGVVQVVDRAACDAMVNAFRADAQKPNFAGLLIDFDHFSLDEKLKSEAAGWITALEARFQTEDQRLKTEDAYNAGGILTTEVAENTEMNAGLWGKIRWSDVGEDCVKGGRYRFISPVWARADCESVGADAASGKGPSTTSTASGQAGSGQGIPRLRPVRLMNAALTNDPNLKGMVPLSNRAEGGKLKAETLKQGTYNAADGVEPVPPGGLLDGLRDAARVEPSPPKAGTYNAADGVEPVPPGGLLDGLRDAARVEPSPPKAGTYNAADGVEPVPPVGGTPTSKVVANAAPAGGKRFKWVLGESPEERHCPSCAGLAGQVHSEADWDAAGLRPGCGKLFCGGHCQCALVETSEAERGDLGILRVKGDVMNRVRGKTEDRRLKTEDVLGNNWSDAARAASIEVRRLKAAARRGDRPGPEEEDEDRVRIMPIDPEAGPEVEALPISDADELEYWLRGIEGYQDDARSVFHESYGFFPETPDEIREAEELAEVPEEYRTHGKMSAKALAGQLLGSERDGDPEHESLERESQESGRDERLRGDDEVVAIHGRAEDLIEREAAGEPLSPHEAAFLKRYREIIGDLSDVRRPVGNRVSGGLLKAARRAVRRAKEAGRGMRDEG